MVAHKKSLFLLKITEDNSPGEYKTIAGLEAVNFNMDSQTLEVSNLATGEWRKLIGDLGVKSISVLANGIFKNLEDNELIRSKAFSGSLANMQLQFNNGDALQGSFKIGNYERRGNVKGEEIYSFTLDSAGEITYLNAGWKVLLRTSLVAKI